MALLLGLLLFLVSCESKDFSISDINTEIQNIYVFSKDSNLENNQLKLVLNYPSLAIGVQTVEDEVTITNIVIENKTKTLLWDFEPKKLIIDEFTYWGSNNINLSSYNFDDGEYNIKILNDKGKTVNSKFYISNNINDLYNFYCFYYDNKIIISNQINDYSRFKFNQIISEDKKIEVSFYDTSDNLIKTSFIDNYIINDSFPFMIELDMDINNLKYITLEFIDNNSVKNLISINLSSSNSFF